MKSFLSHRRLAVIVLLVVLAVCAANLSDIRRRYRAFSVRDLPQGQPTAFDIIDTNGIGETHQGQLAAVLVESLFPDVASRMRPGSDPHRATRAASEADHIVRFRYHKQSDPRRRTSLQLSLRKDPETGRWSYGDPALPVDGDLDLTFQLLPAIHFFDGNHHWGLNHRANNEWLRENGDTYLSLLFRWIESGNVTDQMYAARFLSLFGSHPSASEIEDRFLELMGRSVEAEGELPRDADLIWEWDRRRGKEIANKSILGSELWDTLPGVASEKSRQQLREWLNGSPSPNTTTHLISTLDTIYGLPQSFRPVHGCGGGESVASLKRNHARICQSIWTAQDDARTRFSRLAAVPRGEQIQHAFREWEAVLAKSTDGTVRFWKVRSDALTCARTLMRYQHEAIAWSQDHAAQPGTPLVQRAVWSLVAMGLGATAESVDDGLIRDLVGGSELERQLGEAIRDTAR